MHRKFAVFVFTIILFLVLPDYSYSNSSNLFRKAGSVQPMDNTEISMADENIHIMLMGNRQIAKCEFTFTNQSDSAQDVLMGFPASMKGHGIDIDPTTILEDFKVFVKGKNVQYNTEKQNPDDKNNYYNRIVEWYTWNVHFEPGETVKVMNTYKSTIYSAPWERRAGYIVTTGLPWKESIRHAKITFELLDISPSKINDEYTSPDGYIIEGNKVVWEAKDFIPEDNISLILEPGIDSRYINRNNEENKEILDKAESLFVQERYDEWNDLYLQLIDKGIYNDKLFYQKLNLMHWQGNAEGFIKALKLETKLYNSAEIYEWAMCIYPERINQAGIMPPKNIKPQIMEESLFKLNESEYRIDIKVEDKSRDLTHISYSFPEMAKSNYNDTDMVNIRGKEQFDFYAEGSLPEEYSDFIYSFEVCDSMDNLIWSLNNNEALERFSAAFFDGKDFHYWKSQRRDNVTFNWYDMDFEPEVLQAKDEISKLLAGIIAEYPAIVPDGGFIISFYRPGDYEVLSDQPQLLTQMLSQRYYNSALHNKEVDDASQQELDLLKEGFDWGEVRIRQNHDIKKMVNQVHMFIKLKYCIKDVSSDISAVSTTDAVQNDALEKVKAGIENEKADTFFIWYFIVLLLLVFTLLAILLVSVRKKTKINDKQEGYNG